MRGRRLLHDSATGRLKEELQELQLVKDMVFGSATLRYIGDNYRIHDFPNGWQGYQVMLTKVFLAPPMPLPKKLDKSSIGSRLSSSTVMSSSSTSDSGVGQGSSSQWSESKSSLSSVCLPIPRIGSSSTRKIHCDSLLLNNVKVNRARKVRLAIALLFPPPPSSDNAAKQISMRDIIFEQFCLVEHFVVRLQLGVLRAYSSRNNFLLFIDDAMRQFHRDLANMRSPYMEKPAYLHLPSPHSNSSMAVDFMTQMESLVTQTDTKLTHFFWSCLLSAVLTYHVHWLHSFVAEPANSFECGTRVLILSKDPSLAQRLLYVLSYFVRHDISRPATHKQQGGGQLVNDVQGKAAGDMFHSLKDFKEWSSSIKSSAGADQPAMLISKILMNAELEMSASVARRMDSPAKSQQVEHFRYLRSYYDVRFQLSPDTTAKKDGTTFANVKYSIAKNDFQDFSFPDNGNSSSTTSTSLQPKANPCAFFIGSVPDKSNSRIESPGCRPHCDTALPSESKPVEISIPRNEGVKLEDGRASYLSQWVYGSGYSDRYQAGRIIQSCHPTSSDWLKDLQLDLRAAVTTLKTASCIVADTETWEIKVLTCIEEDVFPTRIKQFWVPVTMSGQVAALVESTQLLWQMKPDPQQCFDHMDNCLQFLCQKSEDLGSLLSNSIQSWNVDPITRLLGIETQDIPLLMAACSVHSPSVAHMGGVTIS